MRKKQLWTYISGGILNLFVLGNITSCGNIYHSSLDGNMINKTSGTSEGLLSIAYCNNKWITTGTNGTILVSTDNGNTWNSVNSGSDEFLNFIACNGDTWICVANKGQILVSTDNGNTWTKKETGIETNITTIAFNNEKWIAAGNRGNIYISTDNGNTWTKKNIAITNCLFKHIISKDNIWMIGGLDGILLVSTDNGNTWTKKETGIETNITTIAFNNEKWIAAGNRGNIYISTDNGNTWTKKNINNNSYSHLESIVCIGNKWITVGNKCIFISTDNGNSWIKKTAEQWLTAITTDGINFIAVGWHGTILSSADAVYWK